MYPFYLLGTLIFLFSGFANDKIQPDNNNFNDKDAQKKIVHSSEYIPGTDITDQLRNDLIAGLDVNLPEGHFYTSETIIVYGYAGTIQGAGINKTIIEATTNFRASWDSLFKPEYELTEMFEIICAKGDVTFKNFTILVKGDAPAELHNNPFHGQTTTIDNAIVVVGTHEEAENVVKVTFENLRIKGEGSEDPGSLNGKNLAYPLITSGAYGVPKPFNVVIQNCELESSGSTAIECYDLFGGKGIIRNNSFKDCKIGISTGSFYDKKKTPGTLYILDNIFNNITSHVLGNYGVWSEYCFKNNLEDGKALPDDCK